MGVPESDHGGHRARLRQRLLQAGGDALADHELVEYLLALAIPRRDTKPLAKALLARFGGLGGLLSADPQNLLAADGLGETSVAAIKLVQAILVRRARTDIAKRPVLSNWQALLDYLHVAMAGRVKEEFHVLHLNTRNELIHAQKMGEGTIDEAAVHIREVVRGAMDAGAAAIILVHNHPSGDPAPSRADIELTRRIADAAKRLDIAVHDHIIIGAKGHASLRALGLL
jgi:DNA repair protein RadC